MKRLTGYALLALCLTGCSYTRDNIGIYDQSVEATAWGVNIVSPYGILNAGYIKWNRNVDKPQAADSISSVLPAKPAVNIP